MCVCVKQLVILTPRSFLTLLRQCCTIWQYRQHFETDNLHVHTHSSPSIGSVARREFGSRWPWSYIQGHSYTCAVIPESTSSCRRSLHSAWTTRLLVPLEVAGLACDWRLVACNDWQVFQLTLSEEVRPSLSTARRSQTTGHLLITMPKVLP